jgi:hypothetical protein
LALQADRLTATPKLSQASSQSHQTSPYSRPVTGSDAVFDNFQ